jgi:hypothetical protein
MRIHTRVVIDMASGAVLEEEGYDYEGPVALAKGDGTSKDQLNEQNALQQKSFDSQMDTLNTLKSHLSGYLSGNQGFTPQQMSYMTSQALNQNSQRYNQAGNQVRQALAARGMSGQQTPGGGAAAGTLAGLYGAKASDASNAINTINLQNSQQALNNQFNAASVLSGNAQTMGQNNAVFGSGANNALNQYVSAANQGFGNAFTSGLGGALGKGLGSLATAGISGGLGTALSGMGGAPQSFASLNGYGASSQLPGSFSGGYGWGA